MLPEPRDLTSWWDSVERAVRSCGTNVFLPMLNARGIANLGPVLLGDVAWRIVMADTPANWSDLKQIVNSRWGLTQWELR